MTLEAILPTKLPFTLMCRKGNVPQLVPKSILEEIQHNKATNTKAKAMKLHLRIIKPSLHLL
jgi:hypothetical protein